MPADLGASFVVLQHLDPSHQSMTAEILSRHTSMPVQQIRQGMIVEQDHVYVIPPNAYVTLDGDQIAVGEAILQHGLRMPIDKFFSSLAQVRQQGAIGIVLSGTGSDGSRGLREIKAGGGIVIVQSPETAGFDGMPQAAIATGQVDVICPVNEMAARLKSYLEHDYVQAASRASAALESVDDEGQLNSVIAVLRAQLGVDFRGYKKGTLGRRIARRMGLRNIANVADYLNCLREQPDEAKKLYQDLLISVTSFFRDPEAFKALYDEAIVDIVRKKQSQDEIRIWVPGCATGEEAYSIAMLVIEELDRTQKICPILIFASDIDEVALGIGRAGIYPANLVAEIPPDRLQRFFVRHGEDYQVTRELRETVTFALQNVITDPPFSRLDLISCRNLLIYLSGNIQDRILGYFHFALREGGYLFRGKSESMAQLEQWFEPVDKASRLMRRLKNAPSQVAQFPISGALTRASGNTIAPVLRPKETVRLRDLMQQQLLRSYAPAAVMTNAKRQVLYFMGPTSHYLEQPTGLPTQDLLTLAHAELRKSLREGIRQALESSDPVTFGNIAPRRGQSRPPTRITVRQVSAPDQSEALLLVTFEDESGAASAEANAAPPAPADQARVGVLEKKLRDAEEDLQINLEELESANEELQASNEEMMSVNEELQSANEELETSKEELQAVNEELSTVNNQLKDKVEQLADLNDDLANFVSSTGIATLLLDPKHRIGRFTPAAKRLFNLIETDLGRPIGDIRQKFEDARFMADIDTVFLTFQPAEREVVADDGATYLMRIAPYRASEQRPGGVVVTFVDISQRIRNEQKLRESEARFRMLVENAPDPLIMVDGDGNVVLVNEEAVKFFGYDRADIVGINVEKLVPHALRQGHLAHRTHYMKDAVARPMGSGLNLMALLKSGEEVPIEISLSPVSTEGKEMICATIRDNRVHRHAILAVEEAQAKAETALAAKSRFLATASHDLRQPLQALAMLNEALQLKTQDADLTDLILRQSQSIESMRSLLNSLLDISKLDAGAIEPQITDVDLRKTVEAVCTGCEPHAQRKGLKIELDVPDRVVRTDQGLLKQILQNLISNAIDYTSEGGVTVSSHPVDGHIRIEVSDTGAGIAEEEFDRIFDEFYQIGRDPQKSNVGLGLGLAIAQRIAAKLDCQIVVTSALGKGSTFSFLLPLSGALLADPPPASSDVAALPARGGIVLLVDDDPAVLKSTNFRLSLEKGLEVLLAASPQEAQRVIDEIAPREPDLIVSDYHLGVPQNGLDVIEATRKRLGKRLPAILISGDSGLETADFKHKDITLLLKPTDGNALRDHIFRILGRG